MKKFIQQVLFVAPIAALIAAPFVIDHKSKNSTHGSSNFLSSNSLSSEHTGIDFDVPKVVDRQIFAMNEPFAENSYFAASSAMHQAMNPATWMKMMFAMANYMQITRMMHQMAAIPTQWMNPYVLQNPQQFSALQKPMHPEQYKEWYEQQQGTTNQQK